MDVIITLDSHYYLIRLLSRGRRFLLLVPPGPVAGQPGHGPRDICGFGVVVITERDQVA